MTDFLRAYACTFGAWALVPGYRHKMALCSQLECPICNRVHSYSLSLCHTLFWNLRIARSTKQWISPELNKNAVHTGTRCPLSTRVLLRHRHGAQVLSWVLEKRVCSHQCPASTVLWQRAWALPKTWVDESKYYVMTISKTGIVNPPLLPHQRTNTRIPASPV